MPTDEVIIGNEKDGFEINSHDSNQKNEKNSLDNTQTECDPNNSSLNDNLQVDGDDGADELRFK